MSEFLRIGISSVKRNGTIYSKARVEVAASAPANSETCAEPGVPIGGAMHTSFVSESTLAVLHMSPKWQSGSTSGTIMFAKLAPVIVTSVPPPIGPEAGSKECIVNAAVYVYKKGIETAYEAQPHLLRIALT